MPELCPLCEKEVSELGSVQSIVDHGRCSDCHWEASQVKHIHDERASVPQNTRVFALIKPAYKGQDFDKIMVEILQRIILEGFHIIRGQRIILTREQAEEHYRKHEKRDFFPPMCDYLTSGPSYLLILEHDEADAPGRLCTFAGPTWLSKGKPGQLRYDYGDHASGVDHFNVIHVSKDREESIVDTTRFFGEEVTHKYFCDNSPCSIFVGSAVTS